jgi:hypothetical protein
MRHYSMGYEKVMALPIRAFWTLNGNVNRLLAEEDLRALMLHTQRQSVEGAVGYDKKLRAEVFPADPTDPRNAERDEAGFADLKAMCAAP